MKKFVVFMFIGMLIASAFIIVYEQDNKSQAKILKPNYVGLVLLHLAPNAPSRNIRSTDKFTGVMIKNNRGEYKLMQSNSFDTMDYGKTFLYKVN